MRRIMIVALALVAALGVTASSATSATTETGVTATSVKIGGTFPLSGPASLYATIPVGDEGVLLVHQRPHEGRTGSAASTVARSSSRTTTTSTRRRTAVQLTRELVEQDNVFAVVGSLGTEVNLAIRPYLNSKKVPHMLVSTGATTWGADWKQYPWTTGWQPNYQFEGKIYGQAIARNSPNAKIARPLPERRLRQGPTRRPRGGPRSQDVQHRRQGAVRGHRDRASASQIAKLKAIGRDGLRDHRDADEDDPGLRDRRRAQVVAGRRSTRTPSPRPTRS